jgi:hypothetical protein
MNAWRLQPSARPSSRPGDKHRPASNGLPERQEMGRACIVTIAAAALLLVLALGVAVAVLLAYLLAYSD